MALRIRFYGASGIGLTVIGPSELKSTLVCARPTPPNASDKLGSWRMKLKSPKQSPGLLTLLWARLKLWWLRVRKG